MNNFNSPPLPKATSLEEFPSLRLPKNYLMKQDSKIKMLRKKFIKQETVKLVPMTSEDIGQAAIWIDQDELVS
jgi:hypothetical protein